MEATIASHMPVRPTRLSAVVTTVKLKSHHTQATQGYSPKTIEGTPVFSETPLRIGPHITQGTRTSFFGGNFAIKRRNQLLAVFQEANHYSVHIVPLPTIIVFFDVFYVLCHAQEWVWRFSDISEGCCHHVNGHADFILMSILRVVRPSLTSAAYPSPTFL